MIGIFGGTFDPVHFGHLRTALEIKESLELAQVRLVPCRRPPHREPPAASAEQRLIMLRSAVQNEPAITIDPQELQREGASFSVDTLAAIRKETGETTPICLIVGMDAFAGLETWHRWRTLFDLAHIVVMQRAGIAPSLPHTLTEFIEDKTAQTVSMLHSNPSGLILFQEVIQLDISATRIRRLIKEGRNPRWLLPDSVLQMIKEQHLYTQSCQQINY
jgi:nicotinate-nucleotide adenylyltransferase